MVMMMGMMVMGMMMRRGRFLLFFGLLVMSLGALASGNGESLGSMGRGRAEDDFADEIRSNALLDRKEEQARISGGKVGGGRDHGDADDHGFLDYSELAGRRQGVRERLLGMRNKMRPADAGLTLGLPKWKDGGDDDDGDEEAAMVGPSGGNGLDRHWTTMETELGEERDNDENEKTQTEMMKHSGMIQEDAFGSESVAIRVASHAEISNDDTSSVMIETTTTPTKRKKADQREKKLAKIDKRVGGVEDDEGKNGKAAHRRHSGGNGGRSDQKGDDHHHRSHHHGSHHHHRSHHHGSGENDSNVNVELSGEVSALRREVADGDRGDGVKPTGVPTEMLSRSETATDVGVKTTAADEDDDERRSGNEEDDGDDDGDGDDVTIATDGDVQDGVSSGGAERKQMTTTPSRETHMTPTLRGGYPNGGGNFAPSSSFTAVSDTDPTHAHDGSDNQEKKASAAELKTRAIDLEIARGTTETKLTTKETSLMTTSSSSLSLTDEGDGDRQVGHNDDDPTSTTESSSSSSSSTSSSSMAGLAIGTAAAGFAVLVGLPVMYHGSIAVANAWRRKDDDDDDESRNGGDDRIQGGAKNKRADGKLKKTRMGLFDGFEDRRIIVDDVEGGGGHCDVRMVPTIAPVNRGNPGGKVPGMGKRTRGKEKEQIRFSRDDERDGDDVEECRSTGDTVVDHDDRHMRHESGCRDGERLPKAVSADRAARQWRRSILRPNKRSTSVKSYGVTNSTEHPGQRFRPESPADPAGGSSSSTLTGIWGHRGGGYDPSGHPHPAVEFGGHMPPTESVCDEAYHGEHGTLHSHDDGDGEEAAAVTESVGLMTTMSMMMSGVSSSTCGHHNDGNYDREDERSSQLGFGAIMDLHCGQQGADPTDHDYRTSSAIVHPFLPTANGDGLHEYDDDDVAEVGSPSQSRRMTGSRDDSDCGMMPPCDELLTLIATTPSKAKRDDDDDDDTRVDTRVANENRLRRTDEIMTSTVSRDMSTAGEGGSMRAGADDDNRGGGGGGGGGAAKSAARRKARHGGGQTMIARRRTHMQEIMSLPSFNEHQGFGDDDRQNDAHHADDDDDDGADVANGSSDFHDHGHQDEKKKLKGDAQMVKNGILGRRRLRRPTGKEDRVTRATLDSTNDPTAQTAATFVKAVCGHPRNEIDFVPHPMSHTPQSRDDDDDDGVMVVAIDEYPAKRDDEFQEKQCNPTEWRFGDDGRIGRAADDSAMDDDTITLDDFNISDGKNIGRGSGGLSRHVVVGGVQLVGCGEDGLGGSVGGWCKEGDCGDVDDRSRSSSSSSSERARRRRLLSRATREFFSSEGEEGNDDGDDDDDQGVCTRSCSKTFGTERQLYGAVSGEYIDESIDVDFRDDAHQKLVDDHDEVVVTLDIHEED